MFGLMKKLFSVEFFFFRFIVFYWLVKSFLISIILLIICLVSGFMEEKYFKVVEFIVMFFDYDCVKVIFFILNYK